MLIDQSRGALDRAVADGDMDGNAAALLDADLESIAADLSLSGLDAASNSLVRVCKQLEAPQ
jgi:hypothetical protein